MYNDPNATLDFTYDVEAVQARIDKEKEEEALAAAQAEAELKAAEEAKAETTAPTEAAEPEKPAEETTSESGGINFFGQQMDPTGGIFDAPKQAIDGIAEAGQRFNEYVTGDGLMNDISNVTGPGFEQIAEEGFNNENMSGRQRVVAGTIDLAMDGISALIPAMKSPADWWDEKSGRKLDGDPYKKAERDMGGMIMGTLIGGGVVGGALSKVPGAVNLGARTKFLGQAAADLGVDALLSGVSDSTREAGNLATVAEQLLPNGLTIPWASRDADSPDLVFAKNMTENMLLGGAGELVGGMFAFGPKNLFKPGNETAEQLLAIKQLDEAEVLAEAGGDPVIAAIKQSRDTKTAAQLKKGKEAL